MFTNYTYVYATTGTNTSGAVISQVKKELALLNCIRTLKRYVYILEVLLIFFFFNVQCQKTDVPFFLIEMCIPRGECTIRMLINSRSTGRVYVYVKLPLRSIERSVVCEYIPTF